MDIGYRGYRDREYDKGKRDRIGTALPGGRQGKARCIWKKENVH